MKLLTVTIPCYNAAPFLNHTLSMLENQTCRDFEVILVNDGSGDETAAILKAWQENGTIAQELSLPSAPTPFLRYMDEDNRPQSLLDRDFEHGMGVSIGRLREDPLFDYKFVCLSHNTLRGAAGGGVLSAELLCAQGYITRREEN